MSRLSPTFTPKTIYWSLLFVFSFILLLWISPDSYLMDQCSQRCDSAWFFTCGKAWMEGMVPYVDFADSKGPLLWLIYGLGYLLSPTSYHGVFWLSVAAYTVTFHFVWLTARMFLSCRASALVLATLPFFLFFITYHNEVRAEDFCMPAFCGAILFTCQALRSIGKSHDIRGGGAKSAFWLGFCMVCGLLIKWNTFFMMGGMALAVTIYGVKQHQFRVIVGGLFGMGAAVMPFLIYFLIAGNFGAFVQEYFINTFAISDDSYINIYYRDKAVLTVLFVLLAIFCRHMRVGYWLLLAYLPFYVFLFSRSLCLHYFVTAMPFFIFPLIAAAHILECHINRWSHWVVTTILILIYVGGICFNFRPLFDGSPAVREGARYAVMQYLKHIDRSKIMFTGNDLGQGLLNRALPACKYWALQRCASDEMMSSCKQSIRKQCADYIIITAQNMTNRPDYINRLIPLIIQSGYRQCYGPVTEHGKTKIKPLPLYKRLH